MLFREQIGATLAQSLKVSFLMSPQTIFFGSEAQSHTTESLVIRFCKQLPRFGFNALQYDSSSMNDSIVTASSGKDHPNCYNFLEILQLNKPDSISYKEVQSTGAVLHGKLICVNIVI